MSLPALSNTWQFQVNQTIAAGGTLLATAQALMFAIKQALIGAGSWTDSSNAATSATGNWVVRYSCDSLSAGSPGDLVDYWAASTNLVWASAAHSWIVLRQTGMATNFEICIDLSTTTVSVVTLVVSFSSAFSGGTTSARPAAADEKVLLSSTSWGMSATNVNNIFHVQKTNTGTKTRVLFCRNGYCNGAWLLDTVTKSVSGWSNPTASYVVADSTAAPVAPNFTVANTSTAANTWSRVNSSTFSSAWTCDAYATTNAMLPQTQVVANDMGSAWPFFPIGLHSTTVGARGLNGRLEDVWFCLVAQAEATTFPASGTTKQFCVFGDVIVPWNTTTPTFA